MRPLIAKLPARTSPSSLRPRRVRVKGNPPGASPVPVRFEGLESRQLCSVTSVIDDGDLIVQGDDHANVINIEHAGTTTFVNGQAFADSKITGQIHVYTGDQDSMTDHEVVNIKGTVRRIDVHGEGGGFIDFAGALDVNVGNNGTTAGVLADVYVHSIEFGGNITIDDSADTVGRSVNMSSWGQGGAIVGLTGNNSVVEFDDYISYLTVKTGAAADNVNVVNTHYSHYNILVGRFDSDTYLETGGGDDVVTIWNVREQGRLHVQGTSGHDTVNVGIDGRTKGIEGSIDVRNSASFSNIVIDDTADTSGRTFYLDRRPGGGDNYVSGSQFGGGSVDFNPNDVNMLTVKGGSGGNTFNVNETFKAASTASFSETVLFAGSASDTVNVRGTTGGLTVNGAGGSDTVNVGDNGSMGRINGRVHVNNPPGLTTLNLNASASTAAKVVTLDASAATGMGSVKGLSNAPQISYVLNDVSKLNVSTGSGNDLFLVNSTQVRTETTLNGGAGADDFYMAAQSQNMDNVLRPVTVNGQAGTDTLHILDRNAVGFHKYTTFADHFERTPNSAPIFWAPGLEFLDVQKGQLVGNPPLVKDLTFTASVQVGHPATITGRLEDSDKADKLTLTVDWGDGSKPQVSMPGRDPFKLTHHYAKAGTYAVRVIWTDSTGQSNHRDLTIQVTKPIPPVKPTPPVVKKLALTRTPFSTVLV